MFSFVGEFVGAGVVKFVGAAVGESIGIGFGVDESVGAGAGVGESVGAVVVEYFLKY